MKPFIVLVTYNGKLINSVHVLQKLVLCSIFPSYFYRSLLSLVDFVPIQVEVSLSPATDKTELVWNNIGAKCET